MIAQFMPGGWEWIVILIIVLLLFGKRVPEVMRGLGQGIRQFKKGMTEDIEEEPKKAEKKDQPQGGSSIPPPAC